MACFWSSFWSVLLQLDFTICFTRYIEWERLKERERGREPSLFFLWFDLIDLMPSFRLGWCYCIYRNRLLVLRLFWNFILEMDDSENLNWSSNCVLSILHLVFIEWRAWMALHVMDCLLGLDGRADWRLQYTALQCPERPREMIEVMEFINNQLMARQ